MNQDSEVIYNYYFDEKEMKACAARMIIFGCQTFKRAKHIKELDKLAFQIDLQDNFAKEGKKLSQDTFQQMSEFVLDSVPDWIRIIICFENYMKAILLKNRFLIHKIDKNQIGLKTLSKNQSKKPIPLSEFNHLNNFSINIKSKKPVLEGLNSQTIDFNILLKKQYQDEIKLPNKIIELIIEINKKRNNLHFYHDASNSYTKSYIDDLILMDKFVNEEIRELAIKLTKELNPNRPNPKPIPTHL